MSVEKDENEPVYIKVFEKIIETQREQLNKKDIKIERLENENKKLRKILSEIKKSYVKLSEKRRQEKGIKKEEENSTITHIRALLNETPKAEIEKIGKAEIEIPEVGKAEVLEDKTSQIIKPEIDTFGTPQNPYKI